jgi:signal transduction histidine kinase
VRTRRYVPLALIVVAILVVLAFAARRRVEERADHRAAGLRDTLRGRLEALREHARYLARLPDAAIAPYHTYFRGHARVRLFAAAGAPLLDVERLDDQVATIDRGLTGAPPAAGGRFYVDPARTDVRPEMRNVVDFLAPRRGGGTLVLTVYAEPFLAPLRDAGGNVANDGGPPLLGPLADPRATAAGDGWVVSVPVRFRLADAGASLAIALGVVLLGGVVVVLSERQLRAQERAMVQQRLAQTERLGSLGLLAAGIAHEINNPLEGITNWLRLGNVAKAQEGFERIRSIVRDLLTFARPDAGAEEADVAASLERALELARLSRVCKGVEFSRRIDDGLRVQGAPRMLEQVFLNILLNAGAATADGDRRVDVEAARQNGRVRVSFRDHGAGIAADVLPRLFDPFFSRTGGTGLGLSVSYGLVRAVGGDLRAENAEGGGARFVVELVPR